MTVQLYIQSELIEQIPVDFSNCICHEEREAKVKAVSNWLKYRYRRTIELTKSWEIIAVQMSKITTPGVTLLPIKTIG